MVRTENPGAGRTPALPSLTRNFIWTLGGNVVGSGCQWAIVVLLAKISTPEVVGQFALAMAVAIPITFLADFRLRVLYVTDTQEKYRFREMLGLRFVLACVSLLAILITCAIARFDSYASIVTLAVGVAQLADFLSESYFGKLQRDERMDRIAISLIARNILAVTLFTTAVFVTHQLLWGIAGILLGRSLVLLFYDARYGAPDPEATARVPARSSWKLRLLDRFRPEWNLSRQREMLAVALPLAIVSVLVSVNGYVPRYVLESYLGKRDLGMYSAINYIPAGCFMVATALGYAVFARLSKLFGHGDLAGFRRLLLRIAGVYASLGVAGVIGAAVLGRQVLSFVYRPEYAQHVELLRWLMVVGAIQCLTMSMQCGLTAASQFRVQVPLFAGVAATSLIGCLLLVPRMGLAGAALAALISSLVQLCASATLVWRTLTRRARELKDRECLPLETAFGVPSEDRVAATLT
jgi:O-antigen/teichoic acid export membrane protein